MSNSRHTYLDSGNKTTVQVLVQYPDGSQDYLSSEVTIFPTLAQVNAVIYDRTAIEFEQTQKISPTRNSTRTTGTQFAIIQSVALNDAHSQGWNFNIDPTSDEITTTAPNNWAEAEIEVFAKYPDGTSQMLDVAINAVAPEQPSIPAAPIPTDRSFVSSFS